MAKKIKVGSLKPVKTPAEKLIDAMEKPEQARIAISKEQKDSVNRKANETNKTAGTRSQHKAKSNLKSKHRTMLIKPKTDDYLKAIATIYGTSVNEIINKALDGYVAEKVQDPDIGDKIRLLQELQIKNQKGIQDPANKTMFEELEKEIEKQIIADAKNFMKAINLEKWDQSQPILQAKQLIFS